MTCNVVHKRRLFNLLELLRLEMIVIVTNKPFNGWSQYERSKCTIQCPIDLHSNDSSAKRSDLICTLVRLGSPAHRFRNRICHQDRHPRHACRKPWCISGAVDGVCHLIKCTDPVRVPFGASFVRCNIVVNLIYNGFQQAGLCGYITVPVRPRCSYIIVRHNPNP